MQKKILDYIFNLSLKRGKTLLIVMALITVIFGAFIPRLIISSSHQNLIPKDDPEQKKYLKFSKEFGSPDNLIIILEGDGDVCKEYADDFAKEIGKEHKWVDSLFYKVDTNTLLKSAPLYFSVKDLNKASSVLQNKKGWIGKIQKTTSLYSLLNVITGSFKEPNTDISVESAGKIITFLDAVFGEWNDWIKNPNQVKLKIAEKISRDPDFAQMSILQSDGYLFSRDFKMMFFFVQPKNFDDEITYLRPFMADMRKACDRALAAHPELKSKVKVAFTGMPAHVFTETESIYSDVGGAGILSVIIVSLILLIGFRSIKKTIIAVIPTVAGLIISLGLITIILGKLNLISSSFLAVLFGIGIDFGIYLLQRTEEELGNGLKMNDAIYKSVVLTSRSIISGGLTTSLAFFALSLSKFSGYSELGLAAGLGLVVVMITTFLMMPALLMYIRIEPRDYHLKETIYEAVKLEKKKIHIVIMVVSLAISAFSIFAVTRIKMDYNVLKLLPQNTESTIYQQKMEDNSDYKMSFAMITDKNLSHLQEITDKVEQLPTVSRVDSLAKLIPEDQPEKIKIIKKLKPLVAGIKIKFIEDNKTSAEYVAVLDKMSEYFDEAQEKAVSGGQKDLVKQIDGVLKNIAAVREKLSSDKTGAALNRTKRFEREIFAKIEKATQLVRDSMNPVLISEQTFPKEIINRFKSREGTYLAMVSPTGSIWELDFLDKFINGLKKITPNVTGFPATHQVFVRQAASSVFEAMLYSLGVILILLIFDFRQVRGVLLSLMPLVIGMLWSQTVIYILGFIIGLEYNVANIGGLPLLLGLGVVYGLRIVHRWREDTRITAFAATKTTGRGLAFAALAIVAGLVSIVPARHGGVSTFGIVLLVGIVLCMFTALVILPAFIDYLYILKNEDTMRAELETAEHMKNSIAVPVLPGKATQTAAQAKKREKKKTVKKAQKKKK
jgi:uncharacterized protein